MVECEYINPLFNNYYIYIQIEMKSGDIYFAKGFNLYESMSATELFDRKVDLKFDLDEADTP